MRPNTKHPRDEDQPATTAWLSLIVAAAIFLPRILLLPSRMPAFVVWETMFPLLVWGSVMALMLLSLRGTDLCCDVGPWTWALNCGLFAFLLQDVISFALFVPGTRTTFFALLAVSIAARTPRAGPRSASTPAHSSRYVSAALCAAVLLISVVTLAAPLQAELALRRARQAQSLPGNAIRSHPAHALFAEATRLDELDSTAPAEHARWLLRRAGEARDPELVHELAGIGLDAVQTAIDRAPLRFSLWMRKARLHLLRGLAAADVSEYEAAAQAVQSAIERYPARPESHERLGDCLMAVGTCEAVGRAINSFRKALALDDARPVWERFRRLDNRTRQELVARIDQATTWRRDNCPGAAPSP